MKASPFRSVAGPATNSIVWKRTSGGDDQAPLKEVDTIILKSRRNKKKGREKGVPLNRRLLGSPFFGAMFSEGRNTLFPQEATAPPVS